MPQSPMLAWIIPVNTDAHPGHPIYYPPPSSGSGYPSHPIYYPPHIWGGGNEPFPTPPIHIPPFQPGQPPIPTHPIVLPPDPPPVIWPDPPGKPPGGQTGSISNPINLPPSASGGTEPGLWAMAYFQELNGWIWVWVPVTTPPANPLSKKK